MIHLLHHIRCAAAIAALAALPTAIASNIENFPEKPVTIVVQQPSGSAGDLAARTLADVLSSNWNHPVVVENKPGANGIIATSQVVRAKPDGYTLLVSGSTPLAFNPHLYENVPYDLRKDFTYVSPIMEVPFVVLASPKSGLKQFNDFIERAKVEPDALTFGSGGVGNSTHLVMEMIMASTDTKMLHVPFNGVSPALTSVMAGDTNMMVSVLSSAMAQIKAGKAIPLAVSTPDRIASIPDVPTFKELNIKGPPSPGWFVLVGPATMDDRLADKINADVQAALQDSRFTNKMQGSYSRAIKGGTKVAKERFLLEFQEWGDFIKARNIRAK